MILDHLSLQNFRSYQKSDFTFSKDTTVIVGPNTCGKSNIIEAIFLLSTGKSFRTEKDAQMIAFGHDIGRVKGVADDTELEVVLTIGAVLGKQAPFKKYLVNTISKQRAHFTGYLPSVLFSPVDTDLVSGSPSVRRDFLDEILEQVDGDYRLAHANFTKALRQRNALLEHIQETGKAREKEFEYWDEVLIKNGQKLTQKREELLNFLNTCPKDIIKCFVMYDPSIISKERLLQYKDAEIGAGVTLVGPHRDDFRIRMNPNKNNPNESESIDVKFFGSRGQQRLSVLQLKMLQLSFMEQSLKVRPMLLLDDIFSELDSEHIQLISEVIGKQQTIITTTHEEFIPEKLLKETSIIELK